LEINVFPSPEHDFDVFKSGVCYGDTPAIILENLANSALYNIYKDSLMTERIVSITGVNEYTQQMNTLENTQNYYIQVTNNYSCSLKDLIKITFEPVKVSIFTDRIPEFKEKSEYNCQIETDAELPQFSVISGNLPAGIIIDNSGIITGETEIETHGHSEFTVQVTDKNGCFATHSYPYYVDMFIPKVFTPNGDGINDIFLKGFKVYILDRWGITIFEGNDGWDGTHKGKTASEDIYFYKAYISNHRIITGYIGLISK
jgi:gliding motility-associated-like protein